jgi:hypothetical protein
MHDESTEFVVIRAADTTSAQHLPPGMDGRWYARGQIGGQRVGSGVVSGVGVLATAVATDRYETREDGARAQVYEIRI